MQQASYMHCINRNNEILHGYCIAGTKEVQVLHGYCMGTPAAIQAGSQVFEGPSRVLTGYSPGVPKRGVRRGAVLHELRDVLVPSRRHVAVCAHSIRSQPSARGCACRRTGAGAGGPVPYSRSGRARGSSGRGLDSRSLRAHRRRRSPPHTPAALPTANGCACMRVCVCACACVCVRVCMCVCSAELESPGVGSGGHWGH